MFTPRLRLANLIRSSQPQNAIGLLQEVLLIDPLRLNVNAMIGQIYGAMAQTAADPTQANSFYGQAIAAYQAELALSPSTRGSPGIKRTMLMSIGRWPRSTA